MNLNPEWLNKVIANRRSLYQQQYSGVPVSDVIVDQMLENANWAPTHKLTEPWRFVVFTGEGLKKLAEFQGEVYKKVTLADNTFKEDRYQNLITKPMQSSHIISIGMKRDPKRSIPEVEEIGAVFCAVQNMYLTAAVYGVGAYLSTGGITYFDESKEFFGLGPDDRLLGFFHVGTPRIDNPQGKRSPIQSKVLWVRD
jgi:nitroreductase